MKQVDSLVHLHDDLRTAPPLTLAFDVAQELRRRRRAKVADGEMSEQMRLRAMQEAKWASTIDDSPVACAVFAVDMALHWASRALQFAIFPPATFVQGEGRPSYFDGLRNSWVWPVGQPDTPDEDDEEFDVSPLSGENEGTAARTPPDEEVAEDTPAEPDTTTPVPLSRLDLARIRRLPPGLKQTFESGVAPATWFPKHQRTIFTADAIRPPVEALVLVQQVVEENKLSATARSLSVTDTPAALCIGCGWGGAAQAFSALLPMHWVYHQPWPYHDVVLPPRDWEVVVLNVPSRHHWMAAKVASRPGEIPPLLAQRLKQGMGSLDGGKHVEQLARAALGLLKPDTILVLMADYRTYQQAVGLLKTHGNLVPQSIPDKDPVWVAYDNQPWTPHGLPRPSGRMVSFWRAQP